MAQHVPSRTAKRCFSRADEAASSPAARAALSCERRTSRRCADRGSSLSRWLRTARRPWRGWTSAMRALDAGDRLLAERELLRLLGAVSETEPLYMRASFVLAEIELARGDVLRARPRLERILHGPEEQLAEDAASVLARSYATPGERALVWKKYLDTKPSSTRRARALVERVSALLGSGPPEAAKPEVDEACRTGSSQLCRQLTTLVERRSRAHGSFRSAEARWQYWRGESRQGRGGRRGDRGPPRSCSARLPRVAR